jgi:hypothetical protein
VVGVGFRIADRFSTFLDLAVEPEDLCGIWGNVIYVKLGYEVTISILEKLGIIGGNDLVDDLIVFVAEGDIAVEGGVVFVKGAGVLDGVFGLVDARSGE